MTDHHHDHPYESICRQARVSPQGVRDRFPGHPFQAAAWVMDRWTAERPEARHYRLTRLAALTEDYWSHTSPTRG